MGDTRSASIVLIPHNDSARASRRVSRDLVPSLERHAGWEFELIVIDNSERQLDALAEAVGRLPWPSQYVWHGGKNLLYGPALNLAATLAEHTVLVYVCAHHGRMLEPSWIEDLVRPFWDDERVAMAGHPYPSPDPTTLGFRDIGPRFHIQGGVLALRTEVVRRYPYDEGEHAHWGSDIWQSYRLLEAGFVLQTVPSVVSVWRQKAPPGHWKYVHDNAEE